MTQEIIADLTRRHDAPLSPADAVAEMERLAQAARELAKCKASNSTRSVLGALPILAVAFGRKHGIKVRIGGGQAYTDGKSITLPSMPMDAGPTLAILAYGYLYHEAGHIEVTNIEAFPAAAKESHLLKNVLNVVEDIRMEAWRNARYPGSAAALRELIGYLHATGLFGTAESMEAAHPAHALAMYLITSMRAEQLQQPTQAAAVLWRMKLVDLVGETTVAKIEGITQGASSLASTTEALDMARKVVAVLEEASQDDSTAGGDEDEDSDSEDDSTGNGGDSDEGEDSDSEDDSTGNSGGQSDEDEGAEGDGSQATPQGNASGAGAKAAAEQILGASQTQIGKTDLGDMMGEELDEVAEQECEKSASPAVWIAEPERGPRSSGSELTDVESESAKLRTQLATAMQAAARVKRRQVEQGTRIHGRSLHRLFTDDARIFERKGRRIRPNAAVQIILDNSGSMKDGRMEVARKAALAMTVGLDQIRGVASHVMTIDPVLILKEWGEGARSQANRFMVGAYGCTPLAEAMALGASNLAQRREPRKLMLVATDGWPDSREPVKELAGRLERAGVEVIGVGIQSDAPKQLFRSAVCIQSLNELSASLFSIIGGKLL